MKKLTILYLIVVLIIPAIAEKINTQTPFSFSPQSTVNKTAPLLIDSQVPSNNKPLSIKGPTSNAFPTPQGVNDQNSTKGSTPATVERKQTDKMVRNSETTTLQIGKQSTVNNTKQGNKTSYTLETTQQTEKVRLSEEEQLNEGIKITDNQLPNEEKLKRQALQQKRQRENMTKTSNHQIEKQPESSPSKSVVDTKVRDTVGSKQSTQSIPLQQAPQNTYQLKNITKPSNLTQIHKLIQQLENTQEPLIRDSIKDQTESAKKDILIADQPSFAEEKSVKVQIIEVQTSNQTLVEIKQTKPTPKIEKSETITSLQHTNPENSTSTVEEIISPPKQEITGNKQPSKQIKIIPLEADDEQSEQATEEVEEEEDKAQSKATSKQAQKNVPLNKSKEVPKEEEKKNINNQSKQQQTVLQAREKLAPNINKINETNKSTKEDVKQKSNKNQAEITEQNTNKNQGTEKTKSLQTQIPSAKSQNHEVVAQKSDSQPKQTLVQTKIKEVVNQKKDNNIPLPSAKTISQKVKSQGQQSPKNNLSINEQIEKQSEFLAKEKPSGKSEVKNEASKAVSEDIKEIKENPNKEQPSLKELLQQVKGELNQQAKMQVIKHLQNQIKLQEQKTVNPPEQKIPPRQSEHLKLESPTPPEKQQEDQVSSEQIMDTKTVIVIIILTFIISIPICREIRSKAHRVQPSIRKEGDDSKKSSQRLEPQFSELDNQTGFDMGQPLDQPDNE